MTERIIYICDDGKTFYNKDEATEYEKLCEECASVFKSPDREINYNEYFLHDIDECKKAFDFMIEKYSEYSNSFEKERLKEITFERRFDTIRIRYFTQTKKLKCLDKLLYRLSVTDNNGREFQQPYWMDNPWSCIQMK